MLRGLLVSTLCLAFAASLPLPDTLQAQTAGQTEDSQPDLVLTKLPDVPYPPIARAAHVEGDVVVALKVRRDGSVESAVVVSGPEMLKQTALDNAKQAQFECRGCGGQVVDYQLRYSFQLLPGSCNDIKADSSVQTQVDAPHHRVLIKTPAGLLCDPAEDIRVVQVRSWRCLYLWRCGVRKVE